MRKIIAMLIMCFVVALASPSFASVGLMEDGESLGAGADIQLRGNRGMAAIRGGRLQFQLMLAGL